MNGTSVIKEAATANEINVVVSDPLYGDLSNLAHTPFVIDHVKFASVEAFVQYIKYPNGLCAEDEIKRFASLPQIDKSTKDLLTWVDHIPELFGVKAKSAGNLANQLIAERYRREGACFVYWDGKQIPYRSDEHLKLITRAIELKFMQIPGLRALLDSTGKKASLHQTSGEPNAPTTSLTDRDFIKILETMRAQNRNLFFQSACF